MTVWHKPKILEELAMNAEIGAYQPEDGEGERPDDVPFLRRVRDETATAGGAGTPDG